MQTEELRSIVPRVTIAYLDHVDSLVAFDLQGTCPSSQEEDLGNSWTVPERGEREDRRPYCVAEN